MTWLGRHPSASIVLATGLALAALGGVAAVASRRRRALGDPRTIHLTPGRVSHCPYCQGELVCEIPVGICNSNDAIQQFFRRVGKKNVESMWVMYVNTQNAVVGTKEVARGALNAVTVAPRDLFRDAVKRNAHAVIFVHNHPSGNPRLSAEDTEFTGRVVSAGRLLGIPVLDHLVVTAGGAYASARNEGVIR